MQHLDSDLATKIVVDALPHLGHAARAAPNDHLVALYEASTTHATVRRVVRHSEVNRSWRYATG